MLEVIYLIFNEGYAATAGDDWMRPALCEDALRLGRILAGLAPEEPEVHGLVALMEIQASRAAARVGPSGEPILLLDQNRGQWDYLLIGVVWPRSRAPNSSTRHAGHTRFRRRSPHVTLARAPPRKRTGVGSATLYGELAALMPSPVVELNRAVAVSMAYGPQAGLEMVDALKGEAALRNYHLLPSVRGDLLSKLGRFEDARVEFERAAALTRNARERELLLARASACAAKASP